jgi:hypothetical protein
VVFDDSSVGVIEELVDASKEDEGRDVPRIDLDHFVVSVSGISQSSAESKRRRMSRPLGPRSATVG